MHTPSGELIPWSSVHDLLSARARQHRDAPRLEIAGTKTSWAEMNHLSGRLASSLRDLGVEPGSRVCTMMANRIEQLIIWFACSKLGAIWVPLNTALLGTDLAYTLTDAAPAALFIERDMASKFSDIEAQVALPKQRFSVDDQGGDRGFGSFRSLLDHQQAATGYIAQMSDPAVIIYTGGTTGRPKGVILPQGAFLAAGYRYRDAFDVRPDDRNYSVLSLCHVGGTMNGVMGPMVSDIPFAIDAKFSTSNYWKRVRETDASIIDAVGTMITALQQRPPEPEEKGLRVRIMPSTTAQLPAGIAAAFRERFQIEMINLYSLTEIGGILITYNKSGSAANGAPDVGWVDYRVVDSSDETLPPNQMGEILLRPRIPNTSMIGYHNDPGRTVNVWQNLWLHTGDLGHVDEAGYLHFIGRQAHWLRCRGENVSSNEVESVIAGFPGVAEVAVVGVPAELGEEDVKAFVIRSDETIQPADIVAWCAARIASFKVPRYVEFADDFPRSATKREIERHKLRALPNNKAWDSKSPN